MAGRNRTGCLLIAVILLLGIVGLFLRFGSKLPWLPRSLSSPAVITQIKQLHQLATVRYSIQRVIGLTEPKVPLGEESILLIVEGEVQAGVDVAELRNEDVVMSGHRALVRLPPAKLLNSYLNESHTKVWDRHVTWWTPWVPYSADLEHRARLQGLDEIRKAALDSGILDRAAENAESAIRQFLAAFQVEAKFEHQGA